MSIGTIIWQEAGTGRFLCNKGWLSVAYSSDAMSDNYGQPQKRQNWLYLDKNCYLSNVEVKTIYFATRIKLKLIMFYLDFLFCWLNHH